jgi:hypothetical protein
MNRVGIPIRKTSAIFWAMGALLFSPPFEALPATPHLTGPPASQSGTPELGFGENSIGVEAKRRQGGRGEATSLSSVDQADDPYQYMADLQCHDEVDSLNLGCLPGRLSCPPREEGGAKGIPVVWKMAPKGITEPEWSDWKPTGDGPTCLYDERPEDLLPRIAARVLNDFRQLPVAAGTVSGQPSPHTLLGAETNYFAEASEQQFDVTILGQRVHIIATPFEYTWNYGDGVVVGPEASAGGPLPEDRWGEKTRTSHVYAQTGDFNVVLTTHFRGTYSVNGGPPLPIPGQGDFSSAPLTTSVWRSITRHYADNCLENPHGDGCPRVPAR